MPCLKRILIFSPFAKDWGTKIKLAKNTRLYAIKKKLIVLTSFNHFQTKFFEEKNDKLKSNLNRINEIVKS